MTDAGTRPAADVRLVITFPDPNEAAAADAIDVRAANEWTFTTPDVGDDTTDSDVTPDTESTFYRTARSSDFTVSDTGTVTIDVGLVAVS